MIHVRPESLSPVEGRDLLRLLRDLNLSGRVAVDAGGEVFVAGCASLDTPVEHGVRYRLRDPDGRERVLDLGWESGMLVLGLTDEHGRPRPRRIVTEVVRDDRGRALAPALRARLPLERIESLRVERFMRRIIRSSWRALAV